jgi:hypothetical protein
MGDWQASVSIDPADSGLEFWTSPISTTPLTAAEFNQLIVSGDYSGTVWVSSSSGIDPHLAMILTGPADEFATTNPDSCDLVWQNKLDLHASVLFHVNNGGPSTQAAARWGDPPGAGGGGVKSASTPATSQEDGDGYQTVAQYLLPSGGEGYCNTVEGGSLELVDGKTTTAGASNCVLVGTPGSTWGVTLYGSCTMSVTEPDPTQPPGCGAIVATWEVYGKAANGGVFFKTLSYGNGTHIANMPGAVGNNLTIVDGGKGTKFESTVIVTIPPGGSVVIASISPSLKNEGRCQLHASTSIVVEDIHYLQGPKGP